MNSVFQTIEHAGELALAALGGWITGFKLGRAEALGSDIEPIVVEMVSSLVVLTSMPDGIKKRVLTYYRKGQVIAAQDVQQRRSS